MVVVYFEVDRDVFYIKVVMEVYLIGELRVSESYLNIERIIEIVKKVNVDVIYLGYGLLLENS